MNSLKSIILLILFFVINTNVFAQEKEDYSSQWKKIDAFEKKGLTKDALAETIKIFKDAVAKNNEAQQIKAAMFQMKYRNMTEEDNQQKNLFFC